MAESDSRTDPFLPTVERAGDHADALAGLRAVAAAAYAAAGLPTRGVERWKFTDLNGLRKLAFTEAPRPALDALPAGLAAVDGPKLVLVNGRVDPGLSELDALPEGVTVRALAEALRDGDPAPGERLTADAGFTDAPLAALNTAAMADGWLLDIAAGALVERPIHLVFVSAGTGGEAAAAFHPRLSIEVGQGARATIVESHVGTGDGPTFANIVSEIALARDAGLGHYVLQNEGAEAYRIASTALTLAEAARYDGFVLQLGAALSRQEARARLDGPRAECRLNGAYLADGQRVVDNTLYTDHAAPETTSREIFKGVIDDRARGVFQAKTRVQRAAQKTDAQQLHKALLLSASAEVDAKPELEIYADDVACGHGATTGDLDQDQLFYLRARGIPEATARAVLIQAFLLDSVGEIADAPVREAFRAALATRLGQRPDAADLDAAELDAAELDAPGAPEGPDA